MKKIYEVEYRSQDDHCTECVTVGAESVNEARKVVKRKYRVKERNIITVLEL